MAAKTECLSCGEPLGRLEFVWCDTCVAAGRAEAERRRAAGR